MPLRVAMGADHGGFDLKCHLVERLKPEFDIVDIGAYTLDLVDDYPQYARSVAAMVASGQADRGILICGSGVGACVAANKVRGARACLCHDTYSAHQGVEHDDMNIQCLGARVIGVELALDLVRSFLGARFNREAKYAQRVDQIKRMEAEWSQPR